MNCQYCEDPMCPETVIRLRRTLFGMRDSRFKGAYCACCRISVVLEEVEAQSAIRTRAVRLPVGNGWWRSLLTPSKAGGMADNGQPAHCT